MKECLLVLEFFFKKSVQAMEKTLLFELTQGKADSITAHGWYHYFSFYWNLLKLYCNIENNLWIGTSDGQLYLYNIEVTTSAFTGEVCFFLFTNFSHRVTVL